MKRFRFAIALAFVCLLGIGLHASNFTPISASYIYQDGGGNPLQSGQVCFLAQPLGSPAPMPFNVNGQGLAMPEGTACWSVTAGVLASGAQVADSNLSRPQYMQYEIVVADNISGGSYVMGTTQISCTMTPLPSNCSASGGTWSLDGFIATSAPLSLALPAAIYGTPTTGNCTRWVDPTHVGDSGAPCGSGSGGGGAVSSVFGRTGDIAAQSGDYSYSQISGTPTSWAWSALSGVPSTFTPPAPTSSTIGGVKSVDCSSSGAGYFVQKINTDGSESCIAVPSGGAPAFSALTGGTNTSAAMVIGSGASLTATGTGSLFATSVPWSGLTGAPSFGPIPCPGIVNDGSTDNTTALNACAATGKKYLFPSICQGSNNAISFVGPILISANGADFGGSGWGDKAICPTVFSNSSTTHDSFDINCMGSSPSTCLAVTLHDANIVAPSNTSGVGVHLTGTSGDGGSTYHGDLTFLDHLFITGHAQPVYSAGFGNGVIGTIQVYATTASTNTFLVDIGSGSSNSWKIGKVQGNCVPFGSMTAVSNCGILRFRDGVGNEAYVGDANYATTVTAVGVNGTDYASAEITLGDTESITGPLVTVSQNSRAAVHWQGLQGSYLNTTSSPFVMNGLGALVLYNPPGALVSSTPYPLVTKTTGDDFRVVGANFPTGGANLGGMAQDANGEQYFAGTPFTEVADNGLLTPGQYNRLRCTIVAARIASAVPDQLVCNYRTGGGSYASINLLGGLSASNTFNDSTTGNVLTIQQNGTGANAALASFYNDNASAAGYPLYLGNQNTSGHVLKAYSGSTEIFDVSGNAVTMQAKTTVASPTAAVSGTNQGSPLLYIQGNAYGTSGSTYSAFTLTNSLNNTVNTPTNTLALGTQQGTGLTGTFNVDFSAAANFKTTITNAVTGYQVNGAAASGHYLRGNGTNYIDSALAAADMQSAVSGQSGCTTAGYAWIPASDTCSSIGGGSSIIRGTVTVSSSTQAANSCSATSTLTLTGAATSGANSFVAFADAQDNTGITGWGSSGGMSIRGYISSANTLSYKVCNVTGLSITYGTAVFLASAQ